MKVIYFGIVLLAVGVFAQDHSNFGDQKSIHDTEHIKQHLENVIDTDEKKLDPEQERFHYFSMHDLNKDNLIDGLEIAKAITHNHDENREVPPVADDKIEQIVDSVLNNIDVNKDGFIDYMEYIRNQEGDKK